MSGAKWFLGRAGSRAHGFGMVEVLAAVTVLALGLLALAGLHARIASSSAQERAHAEVLARLHREMSDLLAIGSRTGGSQSYLAALRRVSLEEWADLQARAERRVWDADTGRFVPPTAPNIDLTPAEFLLLQLESNRPSRDGRVDAVALWALLGLATPADAHLAAAGGAAVQEHPSRAMEFSDLRGLGDRERRD
jgi:hypothetical protein